MKKSNTILLILWLLVASLLLGIPAAAAGSDSQVQDDSVFNGYHSIDAKYALLGGDELAKNTQSVLLYELTSDTLMYNWNGDIPSDPASFVKIMTALVAIEHGNLSDAVTVSATAIESFNELAATSSLVEDEVLTLEDLLYCMMVDSGNDAASVIAEHVGGSQEAFVQMMNERALELGCTNTFFANPHGLPDEQQYTTARDTARILVTALKNETFKEIFGAVYYTVPKTNKSETRELATGNYLMWQDEMQIYYDPRVTGGRTGVAGDGTRCLATTAEFNGMQLLCIVFGSASELNEDGYTVHTFGGYKETKALLDAGFTGFKTVALTYEGQVMLQRNVVDGASIVNLGASQTISTVLPESVSLNQLSFRYIDADSNLKAPVKQGDVLCTVEIWHNNLCVATTELYAMNDVHVSSDMIVPRQKDGSQLWKVLLIIVIIAIVIAFIFIVIKNWRRIRKFFTVKHRNNGRSNRRGR